jgi:DNA modification methylase
MNAGSVRSSQVYGIDNQPRSFHAGFADSGSAARFFYSAKADKQDRIGSKHPTVKPVDLMSWVCRLITPPGGVVLDPFAGSGSTGEAAWREGFTCHLIEREEEYQADIAERLRLADKGPVERKQRAIKQVQEAGPLFGDVANDNGGGQVQRPQEQVLCRSGRTIGPIGLKH